MMTEPTFLAAVHDAVVGSAPPTVLLFGVPDWVWAVLVSVSASAFTVGGFVLQKKASTAAAWWKLGDIAVSPLWLLGFTLGIIVPIPGEVASYSLAPMSLTTPLSGVSVALNMVLAPRLLGERLQRWPDFPASATILMGTVLTTVAGSHEDVKFNFSELMQLFGQPAFLWALVVLLGATSSAVGYMGRHQLELEKSAKERPTNPNIFEVALPAVAAAGCGCLTNIALKGAGELIGDGADAHQCIAWLVGAVVPSLAQLNYVNRGLRLYPQTVFFPIYSALLVFTNTLYGLIFYREYTMLLSQPGRVAVFLVGVVTIMLGVVLFTFRRSDAEGPGKAVIAPPTPSPPAFDPELLAYLIPPNCEDAKTANYESLYNFLLPEVVGPAKAKIGASKAGEWHLIVD